MQNKNDYGKFSSLKEIFYLHPKMKRTLMLLVGISWTWKSTWIKENNLEDCTISTDEYRKYLDWVSMNEKWNLFLDPWINSSLFPLLEKIVSKRLENQLFTIIDATNCNMQSVKEWVRLAKKYNSQVLLNIFDIEIEESKKQNEKRKLNSLYGYKYIDKDVLEKQQSYLNDFKAHNYLKLPYVFTKASYKNGIYDSYTTIKDYLWETIETQYPYKKMNNVPAMIFWDIHWVGNIISKVKKLVENENNKNQRFIFAGDMIDKWDNSAWIIRHILKWVDEGKKITLIRWNHEKYLKNILTWTFNLDKPLPTHKDESNAFKLFKELKEANLSYMEIKRFNDLLEDFVVLNYWEKQIIITHWWIANPLLVSKDFCQTHQVCPNEYVSWSWLYADIDKVENSFNNILKEENKEDYVFQIHGHRNFNFGEIKNWNCYNLEQWVCKGLNFAYAYLSKEWNIKTWTYVSACNVDEYNNMSSRSRFLMNDSEIIEEMKKSSLIKVNSLSQWTIQSLNFTRDAFVDSLWTHQTTKARWLFIYADTNTVLARSYDKFFNIGEFDSLDDVYKKVSYPVTLYKKENGFLWIVGYNQKTQDLEYFSKSTNIWPFAWWVKEYIEPYKEPLKEILKDNKTAVFEIVNQEKDAHIIPYEYSRVYLLDVFENKLRETERLPFEELMKIHDAILAPFEWKEMKYPLWIKQQIAICKNKQELEKVIEDRIVYCNHEGVVIEDSSKEPQMWKIKWAKYSFWKAFRKSTFDNFLKNVKLYIQMQYGDEVDLAGQEWVETVKENHNLMNNLSKITLTDILKFNINNNLENDINIINLNEDEYIIMLKNKIKMKAMQTLVQSFTSLNHNISKDVKKQFESILDKAITIVFEMKIDQFLNTKVKDFFHLTENIKEL